MDWDLRTKKAKHLLSHTATSSPPTLTLWEKHKHLPAMSEDKGRGGEKDHLERHIPSTQLLLTGRPRSCLVPVLNYKIPKAQGDRQGQVVLSHPSDISIAPARLEEFLLLLCYHKWEGAGSKAVFRVTKITEITSIPRDNLSAPKSVSGLYNWWVSEQ